MNQIVKDLKVTEKLTVALKGFNNYSKTINMYPKVKNESSTLLEIFMLLPCHFFFFFFFFLAGGDVRGRELKQTIFIIFRVQVFSLISKPL